MKPGLAIFGITFSAAFWIFAAWKVLSLFGIHLAHR